MINWDRVHALRKDVGPEDFDDIVDIFLEEVEEVITKLRAPQPGTDLEFELHALKNSALNLGFTDLSELCQAGEKQAASGLADEIDLQSILTAYDGAREAFLKDLPHQGW